jgi:hypothetical protein
VPDAPVVQRGRRALAGAMVGASLWISLGGLAVVDAGALTRVGMLPSWSWLAALAIAGAVLGGVVRAPAAGLAPLTLLALVWLPWVPLRLPASFLMWDGPLEALVWAVAIGATAWRLVPRPGLPSLAWAAHPRRAVPIASVAAAVVFAMAWTVARPRVPAGDEPHYLVITQSLLEDGDLQIENNHRNDRYLAYFDGVLKPDFMRRAVNRQIYSIHAPGVSALVAPGFAAAGYPGAVATVALALAAGLGATWLAAYWLTASAAAAWAGWLSLLAAAPIVLHGYTIYPDPVGAAAMAVGLLALVGLERGMLRVRPLVWPGIGAALAWLPWLHTRFAVLAALCGGAIVARLWGRGGWRPIAAFLAVPAAAAAAWFLYFWRIYGTLNPAAPYGVRPEGGLAFIPGGLVGIWFDQQFGLAPNAPVLVVGAVGLIALARRHRRLAIEIGVLIAAYLAAVASYPMWWGGHSAPGRFALAIVPLLAVPIAGLWAWSDLGRRAVVALGVVSAAITATLVGHERGAFIYNGRDGHALLLDWLSPTVDLTLGLPSVHRDGAAGALPGAAAWMATTALTLALATWLARRRPRGAPAAVAFVFAVPLAATAALPLNWAGRDRAAVKSPASQMAFADRLAAASDGVALELSPTRVLDRQGVLQRLTLASGFPGHRGPGVSALLQLGEVPAGDYDVLAEGRTRLDGTVTVRLGQHDLPLDVWSLQERTAGFSGLVLRLPVRAHSIAITGDEAARASVRRMMLRPRTLDPPGRPKALRAARLGPNAVYALDDEAFLEPGALWVRGERTARLVVQPDGVVGAVIRLHAGPVPNRVTVASAGWREEVTLAPQESRDLTLPAAAVAPAVLEVHSATGFRPSEHGEESRDVRWLGVYATWPEAPEPGHRKGS